MLLLPSRCEADAGLLRSGRSDPAGRSAAASCVGAAEATRGSCDSGEFPKLARNLERVDVGLLPPGFLVTRPMNRAVMGPAKRDGEFIARLAAKRPRLDKSDVMRLRGFAAAQYARLFGHEPQVFLIAEAIRRADGEHALVDWPASSLSGLPLGQRGLAAATESAAGGASATAGVTGVRSSANPAALGAV